MGLAARLLGASVPCPAPPPTFLRLSPTKRLFDPTVPSQEQLCRDQHWDITPAACVPPPTARGPPVSSLPHRPECCLGRSPAFWLR